LVMTFGPILASHLHPMQTTGANRPEFTMKLQDRINWDHLREDDLA
jgi:hypothetical protein